MRYPLAFGLDSYFFYLFSGVYICTETSRLVKAETRCIIYRIPAAKVRADWRYGGRSCVQRLIRKSMTSIFGVASLNMQFQYWHAASRPGKMVSCSCKLYSSVVSNCPCRFPSWCGFLSILPTRSERLQWRRWHPTTGGISGSIP